ncbi:Hsp20/alpha crystallin family protein, partial [Gordonia aichiensis]
MLGIDPFSMVDDWARGLLTGESVAGRRAPRFMPIDVYKVDDHYSLIADLPGVDPGSIDLNVDNGVLTLSASGPAREAHSGERAKPVASGADLLEFEVVLD